MTSWQQQQLQEDPFMSPYLETPPNITFTWANKFTRPSRFSGMRLTPFRIGLSLMVVGSLVIFRDWRSEALSYQAAADSYNATTIPQAAFQPPESGAYRYADSIDTFQSYKYRHVCNVSSLDLHAPFSPLCRDRASMLNAMSSGGRIGNDAPYMPRGCDMRWFTSEEICNILGRFERVVLVGDSMLRHVTGSINILLRKDIGYGAVTDWNFSMREKKECFCNEQFNVKACSVQGIYRTSDVSAHDPLSLSCANPVNLLMEEIVRVPIPDIEIQQLRATIGARSSRPKAFIFGHGLWSDLDLQKTVDWLDTIMGTIRSTAGMEWSGLFVTPNAAGKEKPDEWIVTQGNKALMIYEEAMGIEAGARGVEHLGTWNMSIQSNKYDGVHLDMKGNLVKAMMVLNWLNMLDSPVTRT